MIQTPQLSISKRGLFSSLGILASALLLSGCQDEEYGYTPEQISYQTNFEKTYGKISKDQIWDLSSYNLYQKGLTGGPSNDFAQKNGLTRAFSADADQIRTTINKWWTVEPSAINWLNRNMTEKYDHKEEGSPFKLINPYYDDNNSSSPEDRDFLIIPIYQGSSGMTWDLHLVDDQNDYNIWTKSKDLQYKVNNNLWEEYFYGQHWSETNGVWNADPDKAIPATRINLKNAFLNLDASNSSEIKIAFELPIEVAKIPNSKDGSVTGKFYVVNGSNTQLVTDLNSGNDYTFSGSRNNDGTLLESNIVDLKPIVGKTYDGIAVANDFSNLVFQTSNMTNCAIDAYNPQRIKVFTQFNYVAADYQPLVDFEGEGMSKTSVSYFKGHTINRNNVQTKAMKINTKNLGREFSLYLQTTYSNSDNYSYSQENVKHRSNGNPTMMLALHEFKTQGSPLSDTQLANLLAYLGITKSNCEFMVIGCEDANGPSSDWDYNDVVFLMIGLPKVPKIAKNVVEKRYMIEDLGSTFDFDFNDIVVDVSSAEVLDHYDESRQEWVWKQTQTASIAHLCGTIPFEVYIGEQSMGTMMGKNTDSHGPESGYDPRTETDYATKYVKTWTGSNLPWDPNNNNISVYVWPNARSVETALPGEGYNSEAVADGENAAFKNLDIKDALKITFPKTGNFPYIIAVDQDINWMTELTSVPREWFYTTPILDEYDKEYPNEKPTIPSEIDTWDSFNLGYLVSDNSKITNNEAEGTTTIDFGYIFTNNRYRQGDITITVAMSPECSKDYTAVKGTFVKGDGSELPDSYADLQNFEDHIVNGNVVAIKKEFKLTSEEAMAAAKAGSIKFVVNFATYGFSSDWNPRARFFVNWNPRISIGIISNEAYSPNAYGKKVEYTYELDQANNSRYKIDVYKGFDDSFTVDQKGYITFVLPANSSMSGTFYAYDNLGFFQSTDVKFENTYGQSRAFVIKLSDEYKATLTSSTYRPNFRFVIDSTTGCSADPNASNHIDVYTDWEANYLKLSNEADKEITLIVGDTRTINFTSKTTENIQIANNSNSSVVTATGGSKSLNITADATGTSTITVYQPAVSTTKESNRVTIKVNVIHPEANIPVTSMMMHTWDGTTGNAVTGNMSSNVLHLNEPVTSTSGWGYIFSNAIDSKQYVDLCSADYMIVKAAVGSSGPAFHFHSGSENFQIYPNNTTYLTRIENADGTTDYILDLKKLRTQYTHTHLTAIGADWGNSTPTNIISINVDKYNCPAENTYYSSSLPRLLWLGEEFSRDGWTSAQTITLPSNSFSSADKYYNRKLRVYVRRTDPSNDAFALQVNAGGIKPFESDSYDNFGSSRIVDDSYIDINMDETFYNSLVSNNKVSVTGNNLTVSKIELVESTDYTTAFNLLKLIEPKWSYQAEFTDKKESGRLKTPIKVTSTGTGAGWSGLSSEVMNQYNTIKVEVSDIKDSEDNAVSMTDAGIKLTVYYKKDGTDNYRNATGLTYTYSYSDAPISQIYVEAKSGYKFSITAASLTNE